MTSKRIKQRVDLRVSVPTDSTKNVFNEMDDGYPHVSNEEIPTNKMSASLEEMLR